MNIPANELHGRQLKALKKMWTDPRVLGVGDEIYPSARQGPSIILLGPTPVGIYSTYTWRTEAVEILRDKGFDGHIIVPENRDGPKSVSKADAAKWLSLALISAKKVVFWIPDQSNQNCIPLFFLGTLTNNLKHASEANPKLFVGWPSMIAHMEGVEYYLRSVGQTVFSDLSELCQASVK